MATAGGLELACEVDRGDGAWIVFIGLLLLVSRFALWQV